MTSRLPGWYCGCLWMAAQLVLCVFVFVRVCAHACVHAISHSLKQEVSEVAVIAQRQLSSLLRSSTVFCPCILPYSFSFPFIPVHYVCSLSALAQELWMWSMQPAALQIEMMSTQIWLLTFKHCWKREKKTFFAQEPWVILHCLSRRLTLLLAQLDDQYPPIPIRAKPLAFSAAIFPPFWETHVSRFWVHGWGWLGQSVTHCHTHVGNFTELNPTTQTFVLPSKNRKRSVLRC